MQIISVRLSPLDDPMGHRSAAIVEAVLADRGLKGSFPTGQSYSHERSSTWHSRALDHALLRMTTKQNFTRA
jgi:hypothetical protein